MLYCFFFFSSTRRHTRSKRDWSSDVCSSDLNRLGELCNFFLVHQLEQVGFIHLIQKMHGFLALIITVNDDIEVVSVFGYSGNELLSAFRRRASVINQSQFAVGSKR